MKNKRREYTAQFYKKNHIAFAAALLSSLAHLRAEPLYRVGAPANDRRCVRRPRLLCIVCSALVRSQRHCSDHLTGRLRVTFPSRALWKKR